MGKGKWVQGSFKTIANTGVSPTHRCLTSWEFLGCILYVLSPSPTDPLRTTVHGCEMSVLWRAAGSL